MKKTLIIALLALVAMAGQAKTYKVIHTPEAMACVNVHNGELIAREVIMRDTATTVHFTIEYPEGKNFRFAKDCYLTDEAGNRYALRSVEGVALDSWVKSPEGGKTGFTMHFEPMPKKTQLFDFIEGDASGAFKLLGIHDKKLKLKTPTLQELSDAYPWKPAEGWLKTDYVTVKGRFEGYDAEKFGFTSMQTYLNDIFEKGGSTVVVDIAPDGTFEKRFQVSYPMLHTFYAEDSKMSFDEMSVFARPGETVDITIRKGNNGTYECIYNNGSSKDVERWLRSKDDITDIMGPLLHFKGTIAEAKELAEKTWKNALCHLQMVSRREHYTPMEMQLALASLQTRFGFCFMNYALNRRFDLEKREVRDGVYYAEILDSVEWKKFSDVESYKSLSHIDLNNPLLLIDSDYYFLINRIKNSSPVTDSWVKVFGGGYTVDAENMKKKAEAILPTLRDLMGAHEDNLMAQLCIYEEMLNMKVRSIYDEIYPFYLSIFTHPYVHQKAEQYCNEKLAQTEIATPLPADNPAADLIRSLSAKYPGRVLIFDFWQMGCGPCRGVIQQSKQERAEIAKRDDVKFIFVCGEKTAEGSEAYHKHADEWLAGEEAICITYQDFNRFEELFHFTSIPHIETITPDCRRVREEDSFQGFHNISGLDGWLEWLKKSL